MAGFDRFFPIPGLVATSAVALTLLSLKVSGWRGSEDFTEFVQLDRTTVAITVQVLSHLLGLIQVQAFCTVIKTSFTTSVSTRAFSLNMLQFVHAAATPRVSWSLPWFMSCSLVIVVALSFLPAALWSGAITPVLAEQIITQSTSIPTFQTSNLSSLWEGNTSTSASGSGQLGQWITDAGLFSFDPSAMRSLILNSASDASGTNNTGNVHQKLDKTGFSYINRSYGAGSAVGLTGSIGSSSPRWLSFSEPGFQSDVSCIYNSSSAYKIDKLPVPAGWTLSVFQASGSYANGVTTGGWVYVGYSPYDVFSWGTMYSNQSRSSFLSIATGATETEDSWSFHDFNNIQCQIDFKAVSYSVLVNYTSKTISVTPEFELSWPHYGDEVMSKVTEWLWVFSYVDSSFGGSYLGRSLRVNVNQLQNSTGDFSATTVLRGLSDYVSSCVDDVLVSLASARLVAANATVPVESRLAIPAVVLGDGVYIYGALALNTIVCLIYCSEAIRTRFWRDIPSLDLMDLSSIVTASLKGGIHLSSSISDLAYQDASSSCYRITDIHFPIKEVSLALSHRRSAIPSILPVSEAKPSSRIEE